LRKIASIIVFTFSVLAISAQDAKTDSLRQQLSLAPNDSSRCRLLLKIGNLFQNNQPDSAILYHTKALELAEKTKDEFRRTDITDQLGWDYFMKGRSDLGVEFAKKAVDLSGEIVKQNPANEKTKKAKKLHAACISHMASMFVDRGNYKLGLENYQKALKISEEIENLKGQAGLVGNIAEVYKQQGNYPKALEFYFRSLKLSEEMKDGLSQASILSGIGMLYLEIEEFDKAGDYILKAIKANEAVGNKRGVATNYGNLALLYTYEGGSAIMKGDSAFAIQDRFVKAKENFLTSVKLFEEIGNHYEAARHLGNMGMMYRALGDFKKAIDCYESSLKTWEAAGDSNSIVIDLGNIGAIYTLMKDYKISEEYLKRALVISERIGSLEDLRMNHKDLSHLYEMMKEPALALEHYKEFIFYNDSIYNEQNTKSTIRQEMKFAYEKQAAADSVKAAEEMKIVAVQLEEEKTQRFALYGGFVLIVVFSGFMFNRFKIAQKQKIIIEQKEKETQKQNEIISHQKELVEEKQKEILDSIHYARRIQSALITNEKYIQKALVSSRNASR
jgi:tetratricopeptide (TPR) repeat protein